MSRGRSLSRDSLTVNTTCAGNRPEIKLVVEIMMPKSEYDTVHEFIKYEEVEKTSAQQHRYNLVSRQALPLGFARGAPIQ
jgi:hypothetical protein